jgi:aerobic carbon-monoxide dehydrogenase medium subunit
MSIPAVFDYHPVKTIAEAIDLLQQYGDEAKILAGGHSLIPAMKLRLSQPEHLIDINKIAELAYIREEGNTIAIGATTTYAQLERSALIQQLFPIVTDAIRVIGDQQIRNRGTIGGSIAHADPAADMPGVVLALKGAIVVQGPDGQRTIGADDFFVETFTTALEQNEILIEIRLAMPAPHSGSAYMKLENKASHYAVAGCAAVLTRDPDAHCTAASIAITGSALQTTRASAVEVALSGQPLDEALIAEAASHAADGLELISDIHGSEHYRRQMTIVLTQRAITQALERI